MTKQFKEIIKELRNQRGFTQEGLAQEMNVSKSTVAMWETGDRFPGKELYEQLADFFNVDIDYLYGRTDTKKKHHFSSDGKEYIDIDYLNETGGYNAAQNIFDEDMKILFELTKSSQADRLMAYARYLKELYDKENGL